MRLISSLAFASFASLFGVAACGGSGSGTPADASIDGTPIPDAIPPIDACGLTYCPDDQMCVDTTQDEQHCGDCTTTCTGGTFCSSSHCVCPPAWLPASPSFGLQQTLNEQNVKVGFGLYSDATSGSDALLVGYAPTDTVTGMAYTISDQVGTPPFIGTGFDVALAQPPTADAAAYATAGTITFDTICDGGFSGHGDNLTFSGVDSLTNPVVTPGACSFEVETVNFAFGSACP